MLNGGAFCDAAHAAHAAQRRRREISQHAPRRLGNWHARQGWRGLDRRKRRGLLTTTPQRSRHWRIFIFSPTQAALASLTAPAIQTLTWVHGATIMTVWIWGWCIAASWEIFSPGRWGGYPVAKFFLVFLQERLHHQQPSAIVHSSGGCWFPKANALACRTSSHLDPPHLGPGSQ